MSGKRSRASFESDVPVAAQAPYVLFGTPLPLPGRDGDVADDGSFVPVWKQEVRDERGRRRLHGAFTGGFSAGYFNTVGSKEGWTPSTFVSSRSQRAHDARPAAAKTTRRPEDYMDEEDLADRDGAEKLRTASAFTGLGSTEGDVRRTAGGLAELFRVGGETMGVKLLKRMGWKEGQGIGPKIRRKARLGVQDPSSGRIGDEDTYLFAPEKAQMVAFVKKLDRKGLGYEGESKLTAISASTKKRVGASSDDEEEAGPLIRPGRARWGVGEKMRAKPCRGGIGMGVLNDTGSDDEDAYEMGPRISYNRVLGGDKKAKTKKAAVITSVNPSLRSAPVFISRKKGGKNVRRCHDGRLPLDGFVMGSEADTTSSSMMDCYGKHLPPPVPSGWKSGKQATELLHKSTYLSTAEAAKASSLDPKSRAALLGEAQLPGKSVFDFLSPEARERLAAASGRANLPPGRGEIPEGYALSAEEADRQLLRRAPKLDKDSAVAALSRVGAAPYADKDAKRARYRAYLEYSAGLPNGALPIRLPGQSREEWLRELQEFNSCGMIFKPMTGTMASRFTTSSATQLGGARGGAGAGAGQDPIAKPAAAPTPLDPAEEAAKLGMYGAMTRTVTNFHPVRLLCKRFNVKPPGHVQAEDEQEKRGATWATGTSQPVQPGQAAEAMSLDEMMSQVQGQQAAQSGDVAPADGGYASEPRQSGPAPVTVIVDANVNDALEGRRAEDEVLRAVFGDSSDEDNN